MVVLLLSSALLAPTIRLVKAESRTIRVPDDYSTIQSAVDATNPGDTVYVRSGTYSESVSVNKAISLVGENKANTIVDGVVRLGANDIHFKGFTLNGECAMSVDGENCIIEENNLILTSNQFAGISVHKTKNIIRSNFVQGPPAGAGILVYGGGKASTIVDNTVADACFGVFLWGAADVTVKGNIIEDNQAGVVLSEDYQTSCIPSGNDIIENDIKTNNDCGIFFYLITDIPSKFNLIYHNNFLSNGHQVRFDGAQGARSYWDDGYPSGGNYWSDYSGTDQYKGQGQNEPGSDGICDNSHAIGISDTDHYPLMQPFKRKNPYQRLAELRAMAYGAFADIFKYYRTQQNAEYDKTLLVHALDDLLPFLQELNELSAAEIAQDVAGQIEGSANVISSFKDWLDSLEESIKQSTAFKLSLASAHADQVYNYLTSLENLCELEASVYYVDLDSVKRKLTEEESAITSCKIYVNGFKYYLPSGEPDTPIAIAVADSLFNFLNQEQTNIIPSVRRAIDDGKLADYKLACSADLHVYDSKGRRDGPIYDSNGQAIGFEANIPDSYYFGFDNGPQEVILLDPADSYTILVVGRGNVTPTEFTLTADFYDRTGAIVDNDSVTQMIVEGETQAFASEISSANLTISQPKALYFSSLPVEKAYSEIGNYFNVTLMAQNITDLYGFDFNITWDSSMLTLHNCYYNETLDEVWGSGDWFLAKDESFPGCYKLVVVSTRSSFNTTTDQALFIMEFCVEDPHTNSIKQTNIRLSTDKLSDSNFMPINHTTADGIYRIRGKKPALHFNSVGETCREYGEKVTIAIDIVNASGVEDFEFEIHYDSSLLCYNTVTWTAWLSGDLLINIADGIIWGSTSGNPLDGTATLLSLELTTNSHHVWKDETSILDWENDLAGTVQIQLANLSYGGAPSLRYERLWPLEIDVGPDFNYTFSPIQGDVNNDGHVDITDLRTVAAFFDQANDTYNLTGDSLIDIFDLVVVAANYAFEY
jgi:nitrous oxidase accessory protein NosD